MKDISKRIKELRTERSMTQDELAERLHVTRQAVSNWETGKTRPDIEMLEAISNVFGIELMELLYGKTNRGLDRRRIQPAVILGIAVAARVFMQEFVLPIVTAYAAMHYTMTWIMVYSLVMVILYGCTIPFVLSLISLWADIGLKNRRLRKSLLVIGIVLSIFILGFRGYMILSSVFETRIDGTYMDIYYFFMDVALNQYIPLLAGALIYLGWNKPKEHNVKENTKE